MERDCFYNELKYVRNYACKAAGLDPEIAGWKTAVDAMTKQLADAQTTVEALQRERDEAIREHGKESGFWGRSCARLLGKRDELQTALDAEREKAKGLEGQYQRAYGRAANAEQAVTDLKAQLSQLQALVRAYQQAMEDMRDAVLNGRGPLAEMEVDNDVINAVLGIIDDNTPTTLDATAPAECANHFTDGSKIFPSRNCCSKGGDGE